MNRIERVPFTGDTRPDPERVTRLRGLGCQHEGGFYKIEDLYILNESDGQFEGYVVVKLGEQADSGKPLQDLLEDVQR